MAFPHSHKTVFVLDHGPYFALPCHQVEFDVARRGGPGTSWHFIFNAWYLAVINYQVSSLWRRLTSLYGLVPWRQWPSTVVSSGISFPIRIDYSGLSLPVLSVMRWSDILLKTRKRILVHYIYLSIQVQPLLGWGEEGQTSAAVMSSLAMVGRPSGDARSGSPRLEALLGGIAQGLEALCEPSPIQVKSKGLT